MIAKSLPLLVLCLMPACVTTVLEPEFEPSRVVERIGGVKDTPAWSSGTVPFFKEAGDVVFVSTSAMSGDARPEACARAASELGRAEILRQIRDNLTTSGQLEDRGTTTDPAVETLLAFLSQGQLSGVRVTERYWERREESDATGMRVLRIHCAAKVAISRSQLDQQIRAAMAPEGNAAIRDKLIEAQKQFIDGLTTPPGQAVSH